MISNLFKTLILPLFFAVGLAATVTTVQIKSEKMQRTIPANVILPDSYQNEKQDYPVLYLLHGAGDNYTGWSKQTEIAKLADQYQMIVLCPDGGRTSWYFDSHLDPKYQYETFVAKECVAYMDKTYRTQKSRQSRALCGLSMGGHGALFLAVRHREVFGTAVALSGGVDIRPFPNSWSIKRRLGDIKEYPEHWEKNTVINVIKDLKDNELAISMDCGRRDFFLEVNRRLHFQLLRDGITHNYEEHPGAHNWSYWKKAIVRQMPFIKKQFSSYHSKL